MLAFLEKLTLQPAEVGPEDIAKVRAAGASDRAIEEAMYVSTMFNVMDRLADAFDFELIEDQHKPMLVLALTRAGYGAASVPG